MPDDTIPAIARVECRSEGRGDETPIAISFAGERVAIVDIIDRAVITSVEAGEPVRQRFWVELEDGRRCELTRVEAGGEWRVIIGLTRSTTSTQPPPAGETPAPQE